MFRSTMLGPIARDYRIFFFFLIFVPLQHFSHKTQRTAAEAHGRGEKKRAPADRCRTVREGTGKKDEVVIDACSYALKMFEG